MMQRKNLNWFQVKMMKKTQAAVFPKPTLNLFCLVEYRMGKNTGGGFPKLLPVLDFSYL